MSFRALLFSSTFLTGLAGAALAADDNTNIWQPAVDGINGKVAAFGGGYANKNFDGGTASITLPLGGQFGAQFDGALASLNNQTFDQGGVHLFWRNPANGLLGVYADHIYWSQWGGVNVSHIAGEGEAYLGRWTIGGSVGVEFGNNASALFSTNSTVAIPLGSITTTTTTAMLQNVTRFYDRLTISYYLTDNWRASLGHRYLGGRNAASFSTEYAIPMHSSMMPALFAEARLGEGSNNYGAWAGLRIYFGGHDKTLIRRNREDDPGSDNSPDTIFSILNTLGPGSTSTMGTCTGGEVFHNGHCGTPP